MIVHGFSPSVNIGHRVDKKQHYNKNSWQDTIQTFHEIQILNIIITN